MNLIVDFAFFVCFFLFAILGAAAGANFNNFLSGKNEDNLIFNAISYIPVGILKLLGVRRGPFNTFICSSILTLCVFFFAWFVLHPFSLI